jgi:deoxyribonucleoside regulator
MIKLRNGRWGTIPPDISLSKACNLEMNDKRRLVFEAARLCYELGLSQRQVAEDLGVSPATLTRLLQQARDLGIVTFTVKPPEVQTKDVAPLKKKIRKHTSLKEVLISLSSPTIEIVRREMGHLCAQWVLSVLKYGASIGFSGGRSVLQVIPFLKPGPSDIHVVQLMGGISPTEIDIQADVIARNAAAKLEGTCHVIHGPAIFATARELEQLLKHKIVADVIDRFPHLDVCVVGVGSFSSDNPLMQFSMLSSTEEKRLKAAGCVGDICGRFFDSEGKECDPALSSRILGIRLDQLAGIPKVCVVAAGGEKIDAVLATCKANIPHTLITDAATADELANRL